MDMELGAYPENTGVEAAADLMSPPTQTHLTARGDTEGGTGVPTEHREAQKQRGSDRMREREMRA